MSAKALSSVQVPALKTEGPKAEVETTAGIVMKTKKILGAYITDISFRRGAEAVSREEAMEKGFSVDASDAKFTVLLLECCAAEARKEISSPK